MTQNKERNGYSYNEKNETMSNCANGIEAEVIDEAEVDLLRNNGIPTQTHGLVTTVPQNIANLIIGDKHSPTRNSLRHSRMVVMTKGNVPVEYLPPIIKYHKHAKIVMWIILVIGVIISFECSSLQIYTPNSKTHLNPFYTAVPIILSGIFGLVHLSCCRKEYPGLHRNACEKAVKTEERVVSLKQKVNPPHHKAELRIIGGHEATPHAYPYQVGLRINNGQSFCGGTLISENYVITAAHCAEVIFNVEVILGAHNISAKENTQVRLMGTDIKIHDRFDPELHKNDIAVIKLNQTVQTSYAIQIAKLPSFSDAEITNENHFGLVTGWGIVEDKEKSTVDDMSDTLQVVSMPVMNTDVCTEYYNDEDLVYVTQTNLCTSGYRNKATCSGDSGGPLVYDKTLIGISSFGSTKCEECYPSVFTRVGAFLDWIKRNTDVDIEN